VADLYRRAQISRMANERYLAALAATSVTTPLAQEAVTICQPVRRQQRRYRALNPFEDADAQLLAAVNRESGRSRASATERSGLCFSVKPKTRSRNALKPPKSRDDWRCSTPMA